MIIKEVGITKSYLISLKKYQRGIAIQRNFLPFREYVLYAF